MSNNERDVVARPSKEFFIDMIVKDLSISDCILDLIDNAVDKAVEVSGSDVMQILSTDDAVQALEGYSVEISFDKDQFSIRDTCGGIGVDEAREEVFRFGNPGERGARAGLSVYGIGMKRAFFKLGSHIRIRSVTSEDWFDMTIDVDDWKTRPQDWSFRFDSFGYDPAEGFADNPGTEIIISDLREDVAREFQRTRFATRLRERLSGTYALFIQAGLQLQLNTTEIESALPEMATYDRMTPARKTVTYNDVDILVFAGVTPRADKEPRGWYVFCNGRLVIGPSRDERTGWGDRLPKWHSKYQHFVGYVYFRSDDVRSLPWTTTKQDVVFESPVYQAALREMQIQGRAVLQFLSKMYPSDLDEEDVAEREVIEASKSTPINELPREESTFAVRLDDKKSDPGEKRVWVQYKRKEKDLDRLRQCVTKLRGASNKRIGEYTFDYFLRQECS